MKIGNQQSVLVTVLDWGLGHAARSVPVIRELQNQGVRVVMAGSDSSLRFLVDEFPAVPFYELPSYGVVYPERQSMLISMAMQWPKINKIIKQEKKLVDEIIKKEEIGFIISDNRYGCFSEHTKSVFIGHQLNIQMPPGFLWLSRLANYLHLKMIKKFDEVWIPDEDNGFSFTGILSINPLMNTKRIGILSRFSGKSGIAEDSYDIVAIISGPEPQRTVFENLVREQLVKLDRKSLMIKGQPGIHNTVLKGQLTEFNHLCSGELESILTSAKVVLARPGYSTVMDLATLGKKAIFVPTPGQTEQEYLARHLTSQNIAYTQMQTEFYLDIALSQLSNFEPLPKTSSNSLLPKVIRELICG